MGIDVDRVIELLAAAGLDLVHAFDAHAIGSQLAGWTRLGNGPRLGLLVGNTRALWPHFVAARPSLPAADPLDAYVERTIEGVVDRTREQVTERVTDRASDRVTDRVTADAAVLYSHRAYDSVFLPFQPLAVATGFAAMSDAGLAVHPVYGPWFGLRAVIAVDAPAFAVPARAPIAKPCACTGACEKALEIALANTGDWRAWLAVRDACSMRDHRYSDEQIRFHYGNAWPAARDVG